MLTNKYHMNIIYKYSRTGTVSVIKRNWWQILILITLNIGQLLTECSQNFYELWYSYMSYSIVKYVTLLAITRLLLLLELSCVPPHCPNGKHSFQRYHTNNQCNVIDDGIVHIFYSYPARRLDATLSDSKIKYI